MKVESFKVENEYSHHYNNSNPEKVKVISTLLSSPLTLYHSHVTSLIIFRWISFDRKFSCILICKQISRTSITKATRHLSFYLN